MYFCQPNIINPTHIQQLGEMVPLPSQNTVAICNEITLLITIITTILGLGW